MSFQPVEASHPISFLHWKLSQTPWKTKSDSHVITTINLRRNPCGVSSLTLTSQNEQCVGTTLAHILVGAASYTCYTHLNPGMPYRRQEAVSSTMPVLIVLSKKGTVSRENWPGEAGMLTGVCANLLCLPPNTHEEAKIKSCLTNSFCTNFSKTSKFMATRLVPPADKITSWSPWAVWNPIKINLSLTDE